MRDNPFVWDSYSDQPYPIQDRAYKQSKRRENIFSILWTVIISAVVLPVAILFMPFFRSPRRVDLSSFFGIGVNLDKESSAIAQKKLVDELGVQRLLIRIPLSDIENLNAYIAFINQFHDKDVMINLLQDREHIEDSALLAQSVTKLFSALPKQVNKIQVGNTINRTKWGFFGIGEYLRFFHTVEQIRDRYAGGVKLLGPSVIDFEFYYVVHALFSRRIRPDAISSLLYVDRRGAPENRQAGLDLLGKIDLLYSIVRLSAFKAKDLYITETNWPLSHTAPYAPTSEAECVSPEEYRDYLLRYLLLAIASRKVTAVYWHQLVAAGYGLVDQRGTADRYPAFFAFRQIIKLLGNTVYRSHRFAKGSYSISFKGTAATLTALWSFEEKALVFGQKKTVYYADGSVKTLETAVINSTPIFVEDL